MRESAYSIALRGGGSPRDRCFLRPKRERISCYDYNIWCACFAPQSRLTEVGLRGTLVKFFFLDKLKLQARLQGKLQSRKSRADHVTMFGCPVTRQ